MKNNKKKVKVCILMGSKSDMDTVQESVQTLKNFAVGYEIKVLSAHRTPKDLARYVEKLPGRGVEVVIAAAGMSAALAGTVAAHTILPVIGIPIETKSLQGLDSLLSTVQMPKGIPVACMAIGRAGAQNAAILACQILALRDSALKQRLLQSRRKTAEAIRSIKLKS
ncbi:MAG: 5-(carboxyamino)imidazole ribonucleotide mutase [Candidatus Omnitrophica bacterium]|nr:5-(carboxyamino)imidazole ribonucleotide mutase [Candidatus Omnitrophota bacterium]MBU1924600.1 5-(carboxyamino)imidazole ribonucleotide mutase [Candidatus Omnitrophota bacterium]MBU2063483.1 5-(carboxyamino)imidazole ribonucleotide mutase [Candidatus Omnitrophota bacterium]